MGDRVKSCNDGEVIFTGKLENMGTVIIIDHGYGFVFILWKLNKLLRRKWGKCKKGQNIGILGLSAEEREPILYFETRLRAKVVSPFNFVKQQEKIGYMKFLIIGIIVGASGNGNI